VVWRSASGAKAGTGTLVSACAAPWDGRHGGDDQSKVYRRPETKRALSVIQANGSLMLGGCSALRQRGVRYNEDSSPEGDHGHTASERTERARRLHSRRIAAWTPVLRQLFRRVGGLVPARRRLRGRVSPPPPARKADSGSSRAAVPVPGRGHEAVSA